MAKTPDQSICLRALKASISLSNAGVTLLERKHFTEAEMVLKDALHLIRAAFPENKVTSEQENFIDPGLKRASDHLCRTTFQLGEAYDAIKMKPDHSKISIVSDQDNLLSVLRVVNGKAQIFAIRMEETRNYEAVQPIDIEASIVLFNYASACRCLHHLQGKASILSGAFNFLHMAYGVLSRGVMWRDEDLSRQLTVSMLAAKSLVLLCVDLKMSKESACYENELEYLKNIVDRICRLTNYCAPQHAPVA